jgi:hypothetical protein
MNRLTRQEGVHVEHTTIAARVVWAVWMRQRPLLENPASCDEPFAIGERLVSPR